MAHARIPGEFSKNGVETKVNSSDEVNPARSGLQRNVSCELKLPVVTAKPH